MSGEGSHALGQGAQSSFFADFAAQHTDYGIGGYLVGTAVHTGSAQQAQGEIAHGLCVQLGPACQQLCCQNKFTPGCSPFLAGCQVEWTLRLAGTATHTGTQFLTVIAQLFMNVH